MSNSAKKSESNSWQSWGSIKSSLRHLDKQGLIELIHSLSQSDSVIHQALATRFGSSHGAVDSLRRRVVNLIYPDPLGTDPVQAIEALKTIKTFYRASDDATATVALLLDAIEAGTAQAHDLGIEDESYFDVLSEMMQILVKAQSELPRPDRRRVRARLVRIYSQGKHVGWGHSDDLLGTLREVRKSC